MELGPLLVILFAIGIAAVVILWNAMTSQQTEMRRLFEQLMRDNRHLAEQIANLARGIQRLQDAGLKPAKGSDRAADRSAAMETSAAVPPVDPKTEEPSSADANVRRVAPPPVRIPSGALWGPNAPPASTAPTPTPQPTPPPATSLAPILATSVSPAGQSAAGAYRPVDLSSPAGRTIFMLRNARMSPWSFRAQCTLRRMWNWLLLGHSRLPRGMSVEFAVAANWLLRVGIVILITAVGYFLNYAIENDLITPTGRVIGTAVVGLGVIGLGCRLLGRRYDLLGQGLIGGGLAALYFSIFAGHQLHGLIPDQSVAFTLMICVTILALGVATGYNRLLIAILATLGGLLTPVMLDSGVIDFPGLFGYLAILAAGVTAVSLRRRWHVLSYLSFVGTYVLAAAAMGDWYDVNYFWQAFPFWVGFYLIFSTGAILHQIVWRRQSSLLDVLHLLVGSAIFWAADCVWFFGPNELGYVSELRGLVPLGLTLHNAGLAWLLLTRKTRDQALVVATAGLAGFFLAAALPRLLDDSWLTVTWSLEALLLLGIALRLRSRVLAAVAIGGYLLLLMRLGLRDMPEQYGSMVPAAMMVGPYLNEILKRLVLFGVPCLSLAGGAWFLARAWRWQTDLLEMRRTTGKRAEEDPLAPPHVLGTLAVIFGGAAIGVLFVYLQLEVGRTLGHFHDPLRLPMMTLLWVGLAGGLLASYRPILQRGLPALATVIEVAFSLSVLGIFVKLCSDLPSWGLRVFDEANGPLEELSNLLLYGDVYRWGDAAMRLVDFGPVIAILAVGAIVLRRCRSEFAMIAEHVLGWSALLVLFVVTSLEVNSALRQFVPEFRYGGVSILWAEFALSLVLVGIWRRQLAQRVVGLLLFAIVSVKIYFVDLAHLGVISKVTALFVLGLIVLGGSVLYLRYRQRLLGEDETSTVRNGESSRQTGASRKEHASRVSNAP